jgi:hypothetical protein
MLGITSEITFLSASQIAEQVRKHQLSPLEVVQAHLARIEKINSKINAFVQVDANRALQQAREAEARLLRKERLGPLDGVPISIKSSIEVAGMRCEVGTKLRAGSIASEDAPLVRRLKAAGAIVLGVTNTPELLWPGRRITCSMAAPTIPGTFHERRTDPVAVRRRQSLGDVQGAEWAAMAAAPFASRRISVESVG